MDVAQGNEGGNYEKGNQHQGKHLETEAAIGAADGADKRQRDPGRNKPSKAGEKARVRHQLFTFAFIKGNGRHQRPERHIHDGIGEAPQQIGQPHPRQ